MADVFISYSKKHAQLTEDLARDLEAEGCPLSPSHFTLFSSRRAESLCFRLKRSTVKHG
jgi:hypothetical protein